MAEVRKTKKGFVVEYTNTYNGMLEQGGWAGRKVWIPYGAHPELSGQLDLKSAWNDIYTVEALLVQVAIGRVGTHWPRKILRKGTRIA